MTNCGSFVRALRRAAILVCVLGTTAAIAPTAFATSVNGSKPKGFPCPGALGPVLVPGNLEVLPGTTCALAATKVLGDVYVDAAATLQTTAQTYVLHDVECGGATCDLTDTTVLHDLECDAGLCTLTTSTIWHDLDATGGSQLQATSATIKHGLTCDTVACTLDGSTVGGQAELTRASNGVLTSNASHLGSMDCDSGVCYLNLDQQTGIQPSAVDGDVTVTGTGYMLAGAAQVGGGVSCLLCSGIEFYDSTIKRDVSIVGSQGSLVCNNTIGGSLSVTANRAYFATCGGNTIGGNLMLMRNRDSLNILGNVVGQNMQVIGNSAATTLIDNHVRNTLTCQINNPAPVGSGNTARHLDGQCRTLGTET